MEDWMAVSLRDSLCIKVSFISSTIWSEFFQVMCWSRLSPLGMSWRFTRKKQPTWEGSQRYKGHGNFIYEYLAPTLIYLISRNVTRYRNIFTKSLLYSTDAAESDSERHCVGQELSLQIWRGPRHRGETTKSPLLQLRKVGILWTGPRDDKSPAHPGMATNSGFFCFL